MRTKPLKTASNPPAAPVPPSGADSAPGTLPAGEILMLLCVPAEPAFVGIVRLALAGLANRLAASFDDVEDLKLAVAEACTLAAAGLAPQSIVEVQCALDGDRLQVEVRPAPGSRRRVKSVPADPQESSLPLVLIQALMDEVTVEPAPAGAVLRLYKRLSSGSAGVTQHSRPR